MRALEPNDVRTAAARLVDPVVLDGCALQCHSCTSICDATLVALLGAADQADMSVLAPVLLDCITAGEAHAAFVARRSEWWLRTAELWQQVCTQCADACERAIERLTDEAALVSPAPLEASLVRQLRACAHACRRCVVQCPCGDQLPWAAAEAPA
jgi:hypothetical protein